MRPTSSSVVTPMQILLMPDMRRVLMPWRIASAFSSAAEAPLEHQLLAAAR